MTLRTAVLPVQQKGKRTLADKAQARADAKAEEAAWIAQALRPGSPISSTEGNTEPTATFTWDFAKDIKGTLQKGHDIKSKKFTLLGVPDLQLMLCPKGEIEAAEGYMSLFVDAPKGWKLSYKATFGHTEKESRGSLFDGENWWGWKDFAPDNSSSTKIDFELLEAISPSEAQLAVAVLGGC